MWLLRATHNEEQLKLVGEVSVRATRKEEQLKLVGEVSANFCG
jgi:hypothetical protein